MKRICLSALSALALAPAALGHPGHDHAYTPGGEQHHLVWALAAAAAIVTVAALVYRRFRSR